MWILSSNFITTSFLYDCPRVCVELRVVFNLPSVAFGQRGEPMYLG